MKKKKKILAKCPSCQTPRRKSEMDKAIAAMISSEEKLYRNKDLKLDPYDSFIDSDFNWACDDCLRTQKAIPASIGLQSYSWNPHFAYFDTEYVCQSCNSKFIFSKKEKQFWYESLKFWVDSEPVNCVDCRKENRKLRSENKILSDILSKKEDDISTIELEKIIEIYSIWDKEEKAKYYASLLRQRK